MRVGTGLSLKPRSQAELSGFRGVDFTSSPFQVAQNRATSAKNLINIEGVNQKRNGWKQLINLGSKIDGIFNFVLNGDKFLLVYAGKKFYTLTNTDGKYSKTDITSSATSSAVDQSKLIDNKIELYINKNKAYIIGCGDYLVFGKYGDNYELRRVFNDKDTYVPTTTLSINEDSVTDSVRASFEEVNLLTSYRKNQMLGTETGYITTTDTVYKIGKEYFSKDGDNYTRLTNYTIGGPISSSIYEIKSKTWTIDAGSIDDLSDVEIILETMDGENAVTKNITNGNNSYRYDALVAGTDYQVGDEIIEELYILSATDYLLTSDTTFINGKTYYKRFTNKGRLYFSEDSLFELQVGEIDFNEGKITLKTNTTPQISGRDNIIVKFSKTLEGYSDRIEKCTTSVLFGAGGNTDRLFISGNSDFKNMNFWSEAADYTYFRENSYDTMGGDSVAIKGFARVSDSTLLVFKEDNGQEATIFYVTGKNVEETDSLGNIEYNTYFYKQAGTIGESIITPHATGNLAGDTLILSRNGVFGLEISTNVSTTERYSKERSRYINGKLCGLDNLQDACAVVYKNRYYLSIPDANEGGIVFIADARYTSTSEEDVNDTMNYEWWYWTNVDARVWAVIDNELYFGTSNGLICVFDDQYSDRIFQNTSVGDLSVTFSTNKIAYNMALSSELRENDGIKLSGADIFALLLSEDDITEIGYEYNPLTENEDWTSGNSITGNKVYEYDEEYGYFQTADTTYETGKDYFLKVGKWLLGDNSKIEKLYDGIEVYADNVENTGLSVNTKYKITNVDLGNARFGLKNEDGEDIEIESVGFRLCRIVSGLDLLVSEVDEDNATFTIKEHEDTADLDLVLYNSNTPSGLTAVITFKKNIYACWYTPVLDFGTNISSKTLLGITISTEPAQKGSIVFGYETRQTNRDYTAKTGTGFSFEDINFEDFSFDSAFANSYTVKLKERNFNFIVFRFISDNQYYCAVNTLAITYKINKLNKGVR